MKVDQAISREMMVESNRQQNLTNTGVVPSLMEKVGRCVCSGVRVQVFVQVLVQLFVQVFVQL